MEEIRRYQLGREGYPGRLSKIPDPPGELYVIGELPREDMPSVAIVGARDCSEYGRYVAGELGRFLGSRGVSVISGMARGIDGVSQAAALDGGGRSYAILGSGVDVCYPRENAELYERLKSRGGILSEYAPGTPALARNFPPRNRIVSGLSDVLVVIEARVKSGTLITVDMALEQGREVYVVPGRVTDRLSDGCNRLIQQGAGLLLSPEEFLTEILEKYAKTFDCEAAAGASRGRGAQALRKRGRRESEGAENVGEEAAEILRVLEYTPLSAEEILARLPKRYRTLPVLPCLMELCVEGLAAQVSPGSFIRSAEKKKKKAFDA